MTITYADKIPNNVDLGSDKVLQRALEHWQPEFLKWWMDMGPESAQSADAALLDLETLDVCYAIPFNLMVEKPSRENWGG